MHKIIPTIITFFICFNNVSFADIVVAGVGRLPIKESANSASFRIPIETKGATATEAASQNTAATKSTVDKIKSILIESQSVSTKGYNIYPIYKLENNNAKTVTGFRAINYVVVETKQLRDFSSILDKVIASGITKIEGLTIGNEQTDMYYQQALDYAVTNATERAYKIAAAGGLSVTGISDVYVQDQSTSLIPKDELSPKLNTATTNGNNEGSTSSDSGIEIKAIVAVVFKTAPL